MRVESKYALAAGRVREINIDRETYCGEADRQTINNVRARTAVVRAWRRFSSKFVNICFATGRGASLKRVGQVYPQARIGVEGLLDGGRLARQTEHCVR